MEIDLTLLRAAGASKEILKKSITVSGGSGGGLTPNQFEKQAGNLSKRPEETAMVHFGSQQVKFGEYLAALNKKQPS